MDNVYLTRPPVYDIDTMYDMDVSRYNPNTYRIMDELTPTSPYEQQMKRLTRVSNRQNKKRTMKRTMKRTKQSMSPLSDNKRNPMQDVKVPSVHELFNKIIKQKTGPLIDVNNLRKYYMKTLNHLQSYTNDQLNALNQKLSKYSIPLLKQGILLHMFILFKEQGAGKDISKLKHSLKVKKPTQKGLYPCIHGYTIINEIGVGSFGTIYLAEKKKQTYAIKEIIIHNGKDIMGADPELQLHKVEHEIRMASLLGKLNIGPKLYESYICKERASSKVYLVMEHMTEGSLFNWLNTNSLSATQTKQIVDKIKKMHKKKLIHNDLHLGNIFVTTKKGKIEFYLGDFGESMSPHNIYEAGFERDKYIFTQNLNIKMNEKYNWIIACLFILWNLI